jgi:hypothetical protein
LDWKNKPLVVAVLAVVPTIAILIAIYSGIVIPTMTESQRIEIKALQQKLGAYSEVIDSKNRRIAELEAELVKQNRDASEVIDSKNRRIAELEAELIKKKWGYNSIFGHPDAPYPVDLSKVKVGNLITDIEHAYAFNRENIRRLDTEIVMIWKTGPFNEVIFSFNSDEKNPVVTSIVFHMREISDYKVIINDAIKYLGKEKMEYKKQNNIELWFWNNINGVDVQLGHASYRLRYTFNKFK